MLKGAVVGDEAAAAGAWYGVAGNFAAVVVRRLAVDSDRVRVGDPASTQAVHVGGSFQATAS
ncbi:hypothetical protein ACQPXB_08185 [Amycolatopsis sp. CA-161197]|uniref:hypothetical protein n=1 Tax=Amycolatopsis sp. CA-161197 TaxID=3239922 RepID=UPI003D945965